MNLTPENTAVVLDSTADFPDAQIRFPNMRVVPLYVRFGEESFRDYVELDPHGFYERLRTAAELPTTSQPTPQDFMSTYNALSGYERIYSLHISSRLSGTFQSASLAASEVGGGSEATLQGSSRLGDPLLRIPNLRNIGRVRLIDTESASVGIGMLAIAIQELLAHGTTDEEIERLAERHRESAGLLFTVDTLEFLAKGGRIGRARALARARGRQKALEEFRKRFEEATTDGPGLAVGIAHAEAEETVEQLRAIVLASRPQAEIKLVTSLGAVVGTHAGPGTVGFFWFQDQA